MKKIILHFLLVLVATNALSQAFTPGNFVVVRIGSGAAALTAGVAQPVYLDEYNPCGDLVRTIALPTVLSGSNKRLTLPISTSDYTEGYVSLSQDGSQLALAGYDADPGTAAVSSSASTTVKRVVGIIDQSGAVNTSTALSAFNGQSIRAAVIDGTGIWASGGSGGVMYATLGGSTHTQLTTTTARNLVVVNGQLYATSTSGSLRITTVGTGLPVTTGQTMTNLPGVPATGSPYQLFMINAGTGSDVLYVADDNQLKKYSLSGGTWVSNGAIGALSDKYRAVTGQLNASGHVVIYAIRRNDNSTGASGEVVTFTDNTGYNASFAALTPRLIVRANDQQVFRSIVMAPEPVAPSLAASAEPSLYHLQLTPNAARDQVLVTFDNKQLSKAKVVVTNVSGQVVRRVEGASLQSGRLTIDLQGLITGVYYVTLHEGKKAITKKLVKL
ncbi:T9SS type A sorting domain-containing protein [Paraflavitalea sp. CAU 1676]|uniref:T9SS type A sorting domain-containing protein n=1 Tax=Paraflavitalea sp. CAU 1676 TaxID=3032598 RepID=UPI0023DA9530|nr:T9SS type A sorting domain-containing protein [Paraflavitalea sp. CAU 1676]MDF2192699.1 T9SS type A sorting domain-containing protein [Paraflavitalea sp. CAU 1676]